MSQLLASQSTVSWFAESCNGAHLFYIILQWHSHTVDTLTGAGDHRVDQSLHDTRQGKAFRWETDIKQDLCILQRLVR